MRFSDFSLFIKIPLYFIGIFNRVLGKFQKPVKCTKVSVFVHFSFLIFLYFIVKSFRKYLYYTTCIKISNNLCKMWGYFTKSNTRFIFKYGCSCYKTPSIKNINIIYKFNYKIKQININLQHFKSYISHLI